METQVVKEAIVVRKESSGGALTIKWFQLIVAILALVASTAVIFEVRFGKAEAALIKEIGSHNDSERSHLGIRSQYEILSAKTDSVLYRQALMQRDIEEITRTLEEIKTELAK